MTQTKIQADQNKILSTLAGSLGCKEQNIQLKTILEEKFKLEEDIKRDYQVLTNEEILDCGQSIVHICQHKIDQNTFLIKKCHKKEFSTVLYKKNLQELKALLEIQICPDSELKKRVIYLEFFHVDASLWQESIQFLNIHLYMKKYQQMKDLALQPLWPSKAEGIFKRFALWLFTTLQLLEKSLEMYHNDIKLKNIVYEFDGIDINTLNFYLIDFGSSFTSNTTTLASQSITQSNYHNQAPPQTKIKTQIFTPPDFYIAADSDFSKITKEQFQGFEIYSAAYALMNLLDPTLEQAGQSIDTNNRKIKILEQYPWAQPLFNSDFFNKMVYREEKIDKTKLTKRLTYDEVIQFLKELGYDKDTEISSKFSQLYLSVQSRSINNLKASIEEFEDVYWKLDEHFEKLTELNGTETEKECQFRQQQTWTLTFITRLLDILKEDDQKATELKKQLIDDYLEFYESSSYYDD